MKKAQQLAQINPAEIPLFEICDQSTVTELVSLEDLGLCEAGTAWRYVYESGKNGKSYYEVNDKLFYVNTNGGLKADGNPLGATGGAEIFEIYRQLRGEAGERQINVDANSPPKVGCALEFEGFGTKAYVSILGREQK